ncbi:hypothetical protein OU415_13915 [Saccharopolyspora sp. WRP15-2]|uniref:Uncharacterized protein n=1 Tax=Saccharopolyspora oryzae TaxID=2997343 RepID=A0ABT4UYA2_9PSEU|nr:hypothetical protein [Saccharopolyspora oryzae]MDA3626538.1 hypothetical protein [Saccharopolyspora oryzae]
MRKINRMAVLIPGGLLAAAVFVGGCTSMAEQPPPAPGSAVGAANVMDSNVHAVDIAVDLEFARNGSSWMVSYVEGKWDDSTNGAPHTVPGGGPTQVAALAPDVQFLSPFAGGTPTAEPQLDSEGLGVVPISRDDFIQQHNQSAKIWLDDNGQVTKIAARYQP